MTRALALLAAYSCLRWLATCAAAELDLLGALSLHNTTRAGVQAAPGVLQRPAYTLQGDSRSLQVEGDAFTQATELLRRSPEFTVLAALRQEPANSGTILSFSHGYNRYLEVQSSGRRDEVRLHYTAAGAGGAARVETFPFRLADGAWHRLALAVSGAQATLYVDCHPLYRRLIPPPDRNFSQPQLSLWIGQRNSKHSLFKGTLQDVRLVSGPHGYLAQCPGLDSECPTCGQFALLQATVQELTAHLQDLSLQLVGAEARLSQLEQCDCQKSCYSNGTLHADGATWQRDCNRCSCVHGEITCRRLECERAECKNPVLQPGECCPTCLKQCLLKGTLYEHGDRYKLKECTECECHDGNMQCSKMDPKTTCPELPCDDADKITVPGECCKFCPGADYCSKGHTCDENATCMNLHTKYICKCNQGFQGDGITCEDVDECQQAGGLDGHHCHSNTQCVNVVGSYVCQCLPGYAWKDKFNCIEIDECLQQHGCDENAECRNIPGSYECHCKEGYTGNGYTCTPVCAGGCLNGGECAAPGRCQCARGFTGARCERDFDECAPHTVTQVSSAVAHPSLDGGACPSRAACVNTPGSYYCVCRDGYRRHAAQDHCEDIDECLEGLHTCHESARCVNSDGGFRCECETEGCELSCRWRGRAEEEGAQWPEDGGCRVCVCRRGVVSCHQAACPCDLNDNATLQTDMRASATPAACCPQCEARYRCHHQEMHHVVFRSGERWLYQCQICECLLGEVDCWEPSCAGAGDGGAGGGCCVEGPHRLHLAGCAPPHCPACQRVAGGSGVGVGVDGVGGGTRGGVGAAGRGAAPQTPRRAALEPP